jgi:PKD repeat protein
LGLLVLGVVSTAYGQVIPSGRPAPITSARSNARGPEILTRLGDKLPEVARHYKKSPEELREITRRDNSLWCDHDGRLHYVCETAVPAGVFAAADAVDLTVDGVVEEGLVPSDQTFRLHSRPLSTKKLLLDFNGHVTSGTSWNTAYAGGRDIVTPAFDFDGNPASFSTAELDRIQYIWQRVAEDFAPFDVDVTTEDPGVEALRKSTSTDVAFGMRVCVGGSSYDWYGANMGGIAYVGSFGSDKPCFVFSVQMGNGDEKYTTDAITHEAGHTFGLHHDGNSSTAYYQGHNNWAPIMGVGYYVQIVQWSKGEYTDANNKEDDLAIIAGVVGYSADPGGDLMSGALQLAGGSINVSGVISRASDVDLYAFNTLGGTVNLTALPSDRGANLDILLSLYDGAGRLVTSANGTGIDATLATSVAAGTYYIGVDGVGTGSPTTGYSDYGSLGQYRLTGTFSSSGGLPPVAVATASVTSGTYPLTVQFSSAGSLDPDGTIAAYDWDFGDGTGSASANPAHVFNAAGSFPVTLVVRDATGLSSPVATVLISVVAPPNQLPVAAAAVSSTAGVAPLTANFSSAGSYDPDGSISSYLWNFGNGTTSASANPSSTYTAPGNYTVTLTVTDNRGGQSSRSVVVSVSADPNKVLAVNAITMSLVQTSSGNSGKAVVRVVDAAGNARAGVAVTGTWSGLASGTGTATTDSNGYAVFTSRKVRKRGTFNFAVSNLVLAGYTYDASRNAVTSASIVSP